MHRLIAAAVLCTMLTFPALAANSPIKPDLGRHAIVERERLIELAQMQPEDSVYRRVLIEQIEGLGNALRGGYYPAYASICNITNVLGWERPDIAIFGRIIYQGVDEYNNPKRHHIDWEPNAMIIFLTTDFRRFADGLD